MKRKITWTPFVGGVPGKPYQIGDTMKDQTSQQPVPPTNTCTKFDAPLLDLIGGMSHEDMKRGVSEEYACAIDRAYFRAVDEADANRAKIKRLEQDKIDIAIDMSKVVEQNKLHTGISAVQIDDIAFTPDEFKSGDIAFGNIQARPDPRKPAPRRRGE